MKIFLGLPSLSSFLDLLSSPSFSAELKEAMIESSQF